MLLAFSSDGLDLKQTTLIEWARRKGYFIGYFPKWHLGLNGRINRGADRYTKSGIDHDGNASGKTNQKPNLAANRKYYAPGASIAEKPGFYTTAPGSYKTNEAGILAADARRF